MGYLSQDVDYKHKQAPIFFTSNDNDFSLLNKNSYKGCHMSAISNDNIFDLEVIRTNNHKK